MTPFQCLNFFGKALFLGLCGPAIVLGLAFVPLVLIGTLSMAATAIAGTMAIINHYREIAQVRPICFGVSDVGDDLRSYLIAGCDHIASTPWLPGFAKSAFYGWNPVFGYGAISLTFFVCAGAFFVAARILTVIGVGIADLSYFDTIRSIRGR